MLGLGLAISVGKRILGGVIEALMSTLRGRAEYSENNTDSKAVVKDIDNYELLDKASILLTPTATSNARVHSVKTYTGDEFITNGTFDTDLSGWAGNGVYDNGRARVDVVGGGYAYIGQNYAFVDGNTYKLTFNVNGTSGKQIRTQDEGNNTGGLTTSNGTWTLNGSEQEFDVIWTANSNSNQLLLARDTNTGDWSFSIDNVSVVDVSSDFDFDRASSATRINSDGLVQDMQSITDTELVLNGDFEELGDELNDLTWSAFGGWSILDGVATNDGSGSTITNEILEIGKTYKITVQLSTYTSGNFSVFLGSGTESSQFNGTDEFTFYGVCSGDAYARVKSYSGIGSINIQNVSVKQVDPNDRWTLDTGWSIEDGKASFNGGSDANIIQTNSDITIGNTFKITLDVSDMDNGELSVRLGGGAATEIARIQDNGSYVFYGVSISSNITFRALSSFDGSIDNISVKDITFSTDVDLARINYDSNGENGHILLEPTSTNLIPYSEDFTEWTSKSNIEVNLNNTTSPQGVINAAFINEDNDNAQHFVGQSISITSGQDICISVYAKKNQRDVLQISPSANYLTTSGYANYDLTNGLVTASGGGVTAEIEALSNDWYRCIAKFTANNTASGTTAFFLQNSTTASRGGSYDGDGSSGLYIWGAQLEALPYATSYIPSLTGSTVTRATETLNGSGNSTLINSTEGVLYAEIAALANDGTSRRISLSNGSISNRVSLEIDETANRIRVHINASLITYDASDLTSFNKIAVKYKVNDYALWLNGVEVATSSSSEQPSGMNVLSFTNPTEAQVFYGKCKALAVFNEALSDDELELLTGITNYGSFGELASANGYTII